MLYRTFTKGGNVADQSLSLKTMQPSMGFQVEETIAQDVKFTNLRSVFPETWIYDNINGNVTGYCCFEIIFDLLTNIFGVK